MPDIRKYKTISSPNFKDICHSPSLPRPIGILEKTDINNEPNYDAYDDIEQPCNEYNRLDIFKEMRIHEWLEANALYISSNNEIEKIVEPEHSMHNDIDKLNDFLSLSNNSEKNYKKSIKRKKLSSNKQNNTCIHKSQQSEQLIPKYFKGNKVQKFVRITDSEMKDPLKNLSTHLPLIESSSSKSNDKNNIFLKQIKNVKTNNVENNNIASRLRRRNNTINIKSYLKTKKKQVKKKTLCYDDEQNMVNKNCDIGIENDCLDNKILVTNVCMKYSDDEQVFAENSLEYLENMTGFNSVKYINNIQVTKVDEVSGQRVLDVNMNTNNSIISNLIANDSKHKTSSQKSTMSIPFTKNVLNENLFDVEPCTMEIIETNELTNAVSNEIPEDYFWEHWPIDDNLIIGSPFTNFNSIPSDILDASF